MPWNNDMHDVSERLRRINQLIANHLIANHLIANQGNVSSNPQNSQQQNPPRHPQNIIDTGSPRRNTRSPRRQEGIMAEKQENERVEKIKINRLQIK